MLPIGSFQASTTANAPLELAPGPTAAPDGPQDAHMRQETLETVLQRYSNSHQSKRLIIAVDFGTTYSAVSFVSLAEGENAEFVGPERIQSIGRYPGESSGKVNDGMRNEVPTEVIYPLDRRFRLRDEWSLGEDYERGSDEDQPGEQVRGEAMDVDVDMSDGEGGFGDFDFTEFEEFESAPQDFQWGYEVHEAWRFPDTHFDETNQALSRFKLLLDDSARTEEIRKQLSPTLKELESRKIIQGPLTVIADYLTCLLRHAKSELRARGFDESYPVELVMCVPAIWKQKACRDMQTAMAKAMQQADFQGVDIQSNSIENLFIVSEPEAAAAYVLATDRTIRPHDTFVLLDAGGGTVDANTYTVSQATPLRLTSEAVEPGGGLYGSSYLNEAFRTMLLQRLRHETYLEQGKITLNGLVEKVVITDFESDLKRNFDITSSRPAKRFFISENLRDDHRKGHKNGCVWVPCNTVKEMFMTRLEGIQSIMVNQIQDAWDKGVKVDKVILIGGFAGSKSLRRYLKGCLEELSKEFGHRMVLDVPDNNVTAVASGAVLRALNKEQGPKRLAKSSYGIIRTEHYGDHDEHNGVKPMLDKCDGLEYVKSTIDWVLKRGAEVPSVWRSEELSCRHTFPSWPRVPLKCREVLYVSDTATESHYKKTHPKNKGAEVVGSIVVDFSFLRDQGLITPVEPPVSDKGRRLGKKHYVVEYKMIIQVVDRDLTCYAIYQNEVVRKCRINIASAFSPGAK